MKEALNKFKSLKLVRIIGFNRVVLLGVIVLISLLFQVLSAVLNHGNQFLTYARFTSAMNYGYFIGFLALGVTFVIATGNIDFSIGPVMFTSALISGYCLNNYGFPLILSLFLCVLIGAVFGTIGGAFVAYLHLPSFITSMALMQVAKGVGSLFTKTQNVSWPNASMANGWYRYLSNYEIQTASGKVMIPMGAIILLVVAVLCAILLNKTRAGRYMICLGANREAVRLSGVDTRRWEMLAFIICGALAGFASIFYVGCYTTVQPSKGDTFNNEAIAACVMGGTSMAGGLASILGTVIGSFIVAIMQEGILAMGFTISYQYVLTGLIVLGAVIADTLSRRRKN
ncbi:MAG: ABC transporter permease [Clostridiales bacterium]|jgi:ribose transport system permease protein|nr:ABC transporter permease [Bacillota bacterium]NLL53560.1 ABC transporter permease [Clostridiales bacterium]